MEYNITKFQKEDVNLIIKTSFDYANYTCKLIVEDTDDENLNNNNALFYKSSVLNSTWNNGFSYSNNEILVNFNLTYCNNDLNSLMNTKRVNPGEYQYQLIVTRDNIDKVLLNGILKVKENLTV